LLGPPGFARFQTSIFLDFDHRRVDHAGIFGSMDFIGATPGYIDAGQPASLRDKAIAAWTVRVDRVSGRFTGTITMRNAIGNVAYSLRQTLQCRPANNIF
jgi:hypothetical protein